MNSCMAQAAGMQLTCFGSRAATRSWTRRCRMRCGCRASSSVRHRMRLHAPHARPPRPRTQRWRTVLTAARCGARRCRYHLLQAAGLPARRLQGDDGAFVHADTDRALDNLEAPAALWACRRLLQGHVSALSSLPTPVWPAATAAMHATAAAAKLLSACSSATCTCSIHGPRPRMCTEECTTAP